MATVPARAVDFHSHYYEAGWHQAGPPPVVARAWRQLTDLPWQLEAMAAAGLDAKVLSAPAASLVPLDAPVPERLVRQVNERFAELARDHPGRLLALATVDPLAGDAAAREVERAVLELGLGGVCVDCARADRWLDDPAARPALAAAASLGAPVFAHPVSPPGVTERYARLGQAGTLLARGTEDAASVLALLRAGIFDELPALTLVIPMIAAPALIFAAQGDPARAREEGWRGEPAAESRRRLYVDTMGFDPAALRWAAGLLGPGHMLLGSDWPIMPLTPPAEARAALGAAGLAEAERELVMAGNALRLLGRGKQEGTA